MLEIKDKNIQITRGNYLPLTVPLTNADGTAFTCQIGDIVRFKVFEKKNVENVLLEKDFTIQEECQELNLELTADDMKIGELIDKPTDYWYEIELYPDTPKTQTVVGYDKKTGPAILTLLPEGGDGNDTSEE